MLQKNTLIFACCSLSLLFNALHAETKEKPQSTEELLNDRVITAEQKNKLDKKNDREGYLKDRLQNYSGPGSLNEGQIALQLQIQNEAPDMLCIANTGALAVAVVNQEAPPFVFTNKEGELDGIDIQIAKKIAEELGVKPVFVKVDTFDAVIEMVIEKKVNMGISKLSVTSDRTKKVRFAGSYVKLAKALQINRLGLKKLNKNKNLTLTQLFNSPEATIGVLEKSAYESYAKVLFPKAKVVSYKNWDEALNDMKSGKILAVFRDEWEAKKSVLNNPNLAIQAETITINEQDDPFQMVVPWSSPQFAHYLDNFILVNSKYQYDLPKLTLAYKAYTNNNQQK